MTRRWKLLALVPLALPILAGSLPAQSLPAAASSPPVKALTYQEVAEGVIDRVERRVLDVAKTNCVAFPVDSAAESALRDLGASATFTSELRGVCYVGSAVMVETSPAGADVRIGGARQGRAPYVVPVPPSRKATIEVSRGTGTPVRFAVDVPEGKIVYVSFRLPEDTQPVPPALSPVELQARRAELARLNPSAPRPTPPVPPRRGRASSRTMLGGILGAAVGAGAGALLCRSESLTYATTPTGGRVPSGTRSELAGGCLAGAGGGGVLVGAFLGNYLGQRSYRAAWNAYQRESADFGAVLARHDERMRQARLLEEELRAQGTREQVIAENARIRERNAQMSMEPTVRIEDTRRLDRAGAPD